MYQHVFWFYSHPAVYIMMLPGFGIVSEILAVKARKPIFGYRMMAFSLLAIVVLGFTVWAHHMFVSGMQGWIRVPMMVTTAIIAVPTGSRSSRGWRRSGAACCASTRRCSSPSAS
jgi:cytochrome c oxidase subunit 1